MESNPCEEFKISRLYLISVMPSPELEVTIVTFAITAFLKEISQKDMFFLEGDVSNLRLG